jgi:hypothetical protein
MVEHSEVMRFAAWLDVRTAILGGTSDMYYRKAKEFIEATYVSEPQSAIDAVTNMDVPTLEEAVSVGNEFIGKAEALEARVDALEATIKNHGHGSGMDQHDWNKKAASLIEKRRVAIEGLSDEVDALEKRIKAQSANLVLTNNKLELLDKEVKRADTLGAVLDCIGSGDIPGAVGAIRAQNENPSITIHAERNEPETLGDSQVDAGLGAAEGSTAGGTRL